MGSEDFSRANGAYTVSHTGGMEKTKVCDYFVYVMAQFSWLVVFLYHCYQCRYIADVFIRVPCALVRFNLIFSFFSGCFTALL